MMLDDDFGSQDPGEAAEKLLNGLAERCGKQAAAGEA